jgi:hypothetical protein
MVAINWNDINAKGLSFDFRLIKDIVYKDSISAQDVQCAVFDLWQNYPIGTYTNLFTVPSMEPHASQAYKLTCKYL